MINDDTVAYINNNAVDKDNVEFGTQNRIAKILSIVEKNVGRHLTTIQCDLFCGSRTIYVVVKLLSSFGTFVLYGQYRGVGNMSVHIYMCVQTKQCRNTLVSLRK